MTKAELIELLADMDDDAVVLLSTKHNSMKITSIADSKPKKCIWIDLDYDNDDEGE
jgi:hypothetical protein